MSTQGKPLGRGCLFYTGIALAISVVVLITASFLGYRYAKSIVNQFTDTQPTLTQAPTLPPGELQQVQDRINGFAAQVREGNAAEALRLSDNEVNGLFASATNWRTTRGVIQFEFEGTNATAQFSIPAEDLGLKPLIGRFVNASGAFRFGMTNGLLTINAESLSAKGEPFPETFLNRIIPQNFAFKINQDPQAKEVLQRVEKVHVEDGQLVIIPRR